MANRAYLYSIDRKPYTDDDIDKARIVIDKARIVDISEYNWGMPIVYEILLSAKTEIVDSILFNSLEEKGKTLPLALIADYKRGVDRLEMFFANIKEHIDDQMVAETLAFLRNEKNAQQYFLLEAGELYSLLADGEAGMIAENRDLCEGIRNDEDDSGVAQVYSYFVNQQISLGDTQILDQINNIRWSNILYFHFSNKDKEA